VADDEREHFAGTSAVEDPNGRPGPGARPAEPSDTAGDPAAGPEGDSATSATTYRGR
jgi:hypothetical protein